MGTWNTKINSSDSFQDIYQNFFDAYNRGEEPSDISKQIQKDFAKMFKDTDDCNNCFFGLALAQWETKSLTPELYKKVKEIIEYDKDLEIWKSLGADEKSIKQRKNVLDKFLAQISTEREKPKRRIRPKLDFTTIELVKMVAPDNKKEFSVSEDYTNGVYERTSSGISWNSGGGSVFYFQGQGKNVTARWLNNQTLEITHDKSIVFTLKCDTFYFCGDQGDIVYIPK